MAVDAFLKIKDIPGDSLIKGHVGEIEVESYAWGIVNTAGSGGPSAPTTASLTDFTITKRVDKASPLLFTAACSGEHFPDVLFVAEEMGGTAGAKPLNAFLTIKMTDVLISSFQVSGASDIPHESVSFNFVKMEIEVRDAKGAVTRAESCSKPPF